MQQQIRNILIKYWGYSYFRPLQEDIILSVLSGNDTLALLPTGGGKSITFQVPALAKDGMCIVITPLIALMKDQVQNLRAKGIPANAIYSGMKQNEINYILHNAVKDELKLLYISPERAITDSFRQMFKKMNVNLIAVDESHCISQWGYDFRPPYLRIAELREYHKDIPILAVTATATPPVVKDIQEKLLFQNGKVFQKSFFRSNLSYEVYYEENKNERILKICNENQGTGIIYVRNRKKTREIAKFLIKNGISADFYHAGLTGEERDYKQSAWTSDKRRIMVSTNAFGMGIDKPDVRFVLHIDLPDCIEAYFQEAGRAGRDEKAAKCILLYNNTDIIQTDIQLQQSYPEKEFIKKIYLLLGNYFQIAVGAGENITFEFNISDFCESYSLNSIETYYSLAFLEKQGYIAISEAFHQPSKVLFTANKNDLYKFQVDNPNLDPLIKVLLRSYTGLFYDYSRIDEKFIANRLQSDRETVVRALTELDKLKIISYIPASDVPKLTFLQVRMNERDIIFDKEVYEDRLYRAKERLEAVYEYVQTQAKCRSEFLLQYFGETKTKRCGVCDVCLERNTLTINQQEFDIVIDKVKPLLRKQDMSYQDIVALFKSEEQIKVNEVLKWLSENEKIKIDGNIISWSKK